MEKWEKVWNMIISIVPPHVKSVTDADKFISGLTQSIFNWCQDFQMELSNAGRCLFSYEKDKILSGFLPDFPSFR